MEASRRDGTDEWVLPEHSRPPSVKELEVRIDVAMSRARSAETAASAIGAAALEAADQARRSAEAAERSHNLLDERLATEPSPPPSGSDSSSQAAAEEAPSGLGTARLGAYEEDPMQAFIARADQITLRLQKLQSAPLAASR